MERGSPGEGLGRGRVRGAVQTDLGGRTARMLEKGGLLEAQGLPWKAAKGSATFRAGPSEREASWVPLASSNPI